MQQQTAEVTGRASCHDCLLLVSEEPDAILQTIQSRTQRFNIHGIKEPEISKYCKPNMDYNQKMLTI